MQERTVSLEGRLFSLSPFFTVFATQNPVESEGTYPLPEAQLDRFLFKIEVGYPSDDEEDAMLKAVNRGFDAGDLKRAGVGPVISREEMLEARRGMAEVSIEPPVLSYVRKLVAATRRSPRIRLGAGPRASVHLLLAAKALAALRGRSFVTPDDVRYLVAPGAQAPPAALSRRRARRRDPRRGAARSRGDHRGPEVARDPFLAPVARPVPAGHPRGGGWFPPRLVAAGAAPRRHDAALALGRLRCWPGARS